MNKEELIEIIGNRELEIARLREVNKNLNKKIDEAISYVQCRMKIDKMFTLDREQCSKLLDILEN